MHIYSEHSPHATMEAEKPHDLLSASWRPRGVEARCEGWTTREAGGMRRSLKAGGEVRCPSSSRPAARGKKGDECLLLPWTLFRPSTD